MSPSKKTQRQARKVAILCGSTTDGGAGDGTDNGYSGTMGAVDPRFGDILRAAVPDIEFVDYEEAIQEETEVLGVLTLTHAAVDGPLLDKLGTSVKVVSNYGVGVNHLDLDACKARGIPVGNTPGVLSDATADLAWSLLMACARRIPQCDAYVRSPKFEAYDNMIFLGRGVAGKTLGIVGMGNIGGEVARRATGFKMRTLYYNRNRKPEALEKELNVRYEPDLAKMLGQADYVVLVCPLTPSTTNLMDRAAFGAMKDGAILVNVSRGGTVDQGALLEALDAPGGLKMAGLDVSTPEPLPMDHKLRHHANVVWTPHRGSATAETRAAMAELAARNLRRGLDGMPLECCCNGL